VAKSGAMVPPEAIRGLQKDFELDNYELADLFGISISSALDWVKHGVRGQRGNNLVLVDSLFASKWLAENDPKNYLSFEELKNIVTKTVRSPGLLYLEFVPYEKDLGPALSVLEHQRLVSAIMAVKFVLYLRKKGKEVRLKSAEELTPKRALYDMYGTE